MKNVWLFLLTSVPTGLMAAAGSILGGKVGGQPGLFVGAVVFGILGVILEVTLARRLRLLAPERYRPALLGGVLGFALAAPAAVFGSQWLSSPLIPIASVALVGLGVLVASRPRRQAEPPARN